MVDGVAVWDSLTIAETLAELFPHAGVWPSSTADRALARSLCAEMHAAYGSLRSLCPVNIEASLSSIGAELLAKEDGLHNDIATLEMLLVPALERSTSDFLFGKFCATDAFYAPVASRFKTYSLPASPTLLTYFERLLATAAVSEWVAGALAEQRFVPFDEPYRSAR